MSCFKYSAYNALRASREAATTYQCMVKAEGADVVGGDIAICQRLRDLGHNTTLIWSPPVNQ